ncbi:MAG: protein TolR [Myxococcota bacterium]|nr:protein TolR [Myxococcota bacterium]
MSTGGNNRGVMGEINVTPFVDVMLVLLVIFMVTAPMMVQGQNVDLPRAEGEPLTPGENQMILSITDDGTYFINETPIPAEELNPKLAAIAEANPNQDIFVKADGQVPYELVAKLIGAAKQAGIPRVGLVTQPDLEN